MQEDLIAPNQSSLKAGVFCINESISIAHQIYKSYNDGYELKVIFLNILESIWERMAPKSLLRIETKQLIRWTFKNFDRFSRKHKSNSYTKWSKCHISWGWCWSSSTLNPWAIILPNLYQEFKWKYSIKPWTVCWWHATLLCS